MSRYEKGLSVPYGQKMLVQGRREKKMFVSTCLHMCSAGHEWSSESKGEIKRKSLALQNDLLKSEWLH